MTEPETPDLTTVVGENIHKLRKYFRITQQELGDAIGHTAPLVSQIERGTVSTRIETLEAIAHAFGIEPELFMRHEGYREVTEHHGKHPMLRTRDDPPGA